MPTNIKEKTYVIEKSLINQRINKMKTEFVGSCVVWAMVFARHGRNGQEANK